MPFLELSAAFCRDIDADSASDCPGDNADDCSGDRAGDNKKKDRTSFSDIRPSKLKAAATYSPTWWGSTIGASELNFSVRYGKRWVLTAIATAVYFWKQIIRSDGDPKRRFLRFARFGNPHVPSVHCGSLFFAGLEITLLDSHLYIFCQSPSNSLVKGIGITRSSRDISTGRLCHH